MQMKKFLVIGFALFSHFLSATITIEGAKFRPLNIALLNTESSETARIVRSDLELSTLFVVLDPRSYIAKSYVPNKPEDWTNIGAEAVVSVKAVQTGSRIDVESNIYQLGSQKSSRKFSYTSPSNNMRNLSHKISNDIYKFFTGEEGVFLDKIAAAKVVGQVKQIVIMDVDGSNERQLTNTKEINMLPAFSPGGKSILFTSFRNKNSDLYEVMLDTMSVRPISQREGLNVGPSFSPDGKTIALTLTKDKNSEVYLLDKDGSNPRRLTNTSGIDTSPSFSPDGKKIAFVSTRIGNPHIYIMNSDGTGQKRLTFEGTYNQKPKFSPRIGNNLMVFFGRDERNVFDIFLFDLDKDKITRITQNAGNNEDQSFSSNGQLIVFSSTRTGKKSLFVSNLDGSVQKQITRDGIYETPSWGTQR